MQQIRDLWSSAAAEYQILYMVCVKNLPFPFVMLIANAYERALADSLVPAADLP